MLGLILGIFTASYFLIIIDSILPQKLNRLIMSLMMIIYAITFGIAGLAFTKTRLFYKGAIIGVVLAEYIMIMFELSCA